MADKSKNKTTAKKRVAKKGRPSKAAKDAKMTPSKSIDSRIEDLGDWRRNALSRVRNLIKQADPAVVEEVKWRKPSNSMLGVPVWSHHGIICTGETYRDKVKLTKADSRISGQPATTFGLCTRKVVSSSHTTIKNPTFSSDPCIASGAVCATLSHLMAPLRHRTEPKRKALNVNDKCLTSLVAGAGFDAVVRVHGGVDDSPRSCASTFVLNPARNEESRLG